MRFPKLKIRLLWFFDVGVFVFFRLWVRAYWLLPLRLRMDAYYGKISGQSDGVAHSAHVGGILALSFVPRP